MKTQSVWHYLHALLQLRELNPEFCGSYIKPRFVSRSSKWANSRILAVTSFGIRDTKFVEATHRSIKRKNLDRRLNLWQVIQRTRSMFDHILANRHIRYMQIYRRTPKVTDREELNE